MGKRRNKIKTYWCPICTKKRVYYNYPSFVCGNCGVKYSTKEEMLRLEKPYIPEDPEFSTHVDGKILTDNPEINCSLERAIDMFIKMGLSPKQIISLLHEYESINTIEVELMLKMGETVTQIRGLIHDAKLLGVIEEVKT